jgi:titin
LAAVPGVCTAPLQVSDITKNACRLRWKPPEDDGGSRVTHYVIERQEVGKPYWTTVASFIKVQQMSNQQSV